MAVTIDSCYTTIIAKLTDQGKILDISKKLLSFTTNHERVLFVYELLESQKAMPTLHNVKKNENVSTFYRNHGNKCFQLKEDHKAWQYYNLSLLHAQLQSKNYCLALANRSAVFHSLRKYNECLEDVKHVLSLKYPEELKEKLLRRQSSCLEKMSATELSNKDNEIEIEKLLTMQNPTLKRYPCASTKVEVVFDETMGRHVRAAEDIDVGDIIVQENPYFTLLAKDQFLFSCSYCLSRNMNLLPCENCCFSLYCSSECKENAWKHYHSIECPLMPTLIDMEFTKIELLALRTVIKARNDHSNWQALLETIETTEDSFRTEFRGHVKIDDEWVYDSKYYPSIHSLASNIEKRSISDIFQKSVTAAVFLQLLSEGTDFLEVKCKDEVRKVRECVAGTLLLHSMTSPTNMHSLTTNMQNAHGDYVDEVNLASAPYAFHSLLNHSCAPNVVRFGKLGSGRMTLFALRPIKKGMQLFDNYGFHHALQDRISRQKDLNFQYKFTCVCEACVNDWPIYLFMKPSRNIPSKILCHKEHVLSAEAIEKLQKGDTGTALRIFKPLLKLLEDLECYAPCKELADCQEAFKQCLFIFEGPVIPYGQSNLIKWTGLPPKV